MGKANWERTRRLGGDASEFRNTITPNSMSEQPKLCDFIF
jgi:hypothetical protein